jgi:uncharacterized membrane protein YjdF
MATVPPSNTFPQEPSRRLALFLQGVIAFGFVLELYERQWMRAAIVAGILLLTAVPSLLARRVKIVIPPQFELLAIAFIFASLYLGERRDFYARFWWWDLLLHSTSGVLLGILGFLLVFILNESPRVDLHMRPKFVAFFAFCFSVTVGALWEIFEFGMDQIFGTNMQKPMFGDPSGLTDTMWDLIVDVLGTLAVSLYGYYYLRRRTPSTLELWIRHFIDRNPHLFPGHDGSSHPDDVPRNC